MVAHRKDGTEGTSSDKEGSNHADDSSEMSNDSDLTGTDSCDSRSKFFFSKINMNTIHMRRCLTIVFACYCMFEINFNQTRSFVFNEGNTLKSPDKSL